MRALVLQMRGNGDSSREVEQQQYLTYTGLRPDQITFVDLYLQPDLKPDLLLEHDVLFVGGISRDNPTELDWPRQQFPFIDNLRAIMNLAIDKKVPAMLSCGGFIIAGDFFGGQTFVKEDDFELGVYPLQKTKAAEQDIFLGAVSDSLMMVSGHKKYLAETPPGTVLMFYTNEYADRVPVHAFKVMGAPFYAFQGHPEISCAELFERIKPMMYRTKYFPKRIGNLTDEEYGYNFKAFEEFCTLEANTDEAQGLLKRFVALVKEGAFTNGK